MENTANSPPIKKTIRLTCNDYANASFQYVEQEFDSASENHEKINQKDNLRGYNLSGESPKVGPLSTIQIISSNTQDNQSSVMHYLPEFGSANGIRRNIPEPLEDSDSLIVVQFDSEIVDPSHLNSRIAQILSDSKELENQDKTPFSKNEKNELSFSMKTECSIEINDNEQQLKQSLLKKQRKQKSTSKVTFNDTLNTDLFYDINVSSRKLKQADQNQEALKKSEFISVYSKRQKSFEENKDNSQNEINIKRTNTPVLEYKPEKPKNEYFDQERVNSLFDGITDYPSDQNESRLSKLSEDHAAIIFETRKNTIIKGLKKLNKNRAFNVNLPKSNQSTPTSKSANYSAKFSLSEDNSPKKSKIKDLVIQNVVTKRIKSNKAHKTTELTLHKTRSLIVETSPIKNEKISLGKRGRSLSNNQIPVFEDLSKEVNKNDRLLKDKKMIDEMYQLAKEDVRKRIASIEKKLIENSRFNTRTSNSNKTPNQSTEKEEEVIYSILNSPKDMKQSQNIEVKVGHHINIESQSVNQIKNLEGTTKIENIFARSDEAEKEENKNDKIVKTIKGVNSTSKEQIQKNPTKPNQIQEKMKISLSPPKVDKSSTFQQEAPLEDLFSVNSQRSNSKTTGLNIRVKKQSNNQDQNNTKVLTPKSMTQNPTKFSDLEALALQRNSYSKLHLIPKSSEKVKKIPVGPQTLTKQEYWKETAQEYVEIRKSLNFGSVNKTAGYSSVRESENMKQKSKKNDTKTKEKSMNLETHATKEVKYFTLRPQSRSKIDKTYLQKNNFNTSPTKTPERVGRFSSNHTSANETTQKQDVPQNKIIEQLNNSSQKDSKIPRSSSDNHMKVFRKNWPTDISLIDSEDVRLKTFETPFKVYGIKTKPVKLNSQEFSPKNSASSGFKNDNKFKNSASQKQKSPGQNANLKSERSSSPKSEYLKSTFYAQTQKEANSRKQTSNLKLNMQTKYTYVTDGNDLEELLSKNYKFLEIKNNQYNQCMIVTLCRFVLSLMFIAMFFIIEYIKYNFPENKPL